MAQIEKEKKKPGDEITRFFLKKSQPTKE